MGFKYGLGDGGASRPIVALLAHMVVPRGGDPAPNARIAVSHDLSPTVGTGYNLGFITTRSGGTTAWELLYTWTVGFDVGERVGAFAEVFGTNKAASLDGGLTFSLSPFAQLDVSGGVGLNGAADEWFFGAGLAVRMAR